MSEKRRDNRNRILRSGESQRKDGRYAYKYTDTFGKVQFVYAWKLVPTDKTPAGKRDDISLREKEKEIQKDLDDGIDTIGKKMTVCELYAKQNRHRGNVRHNTTKGRERLMKLLEADKLGSCPIDSVKLSDAKEWALRMKEKGISYKTISNDKRSLKAAFYTAIQDDCIRKNPFDFQLNTVIEDDTEPKVPLTGEQEVNYATMFRGLAKKYNKCHEEALPKVMTPHTLRHTFCTNLANAGMNPKALQYIMGHSNITMTLNYYAHATFASARAEMERLIAA